MISATFHIARLIRAAWVFAREGVFGSVDPSLVPPSGQLALRLARILERPGAKSGPRLSRALTRLGLYRDKVDGKAGMLTRAALGAYQKANGLAVDCWPTKDLLDQMVRTTGAK